MTEDRLLLEALKKGDRAAFNVLFEKYSPKLYFFCLKYLSDKINAEEIVQETFLKIWETRSKIDTSRHFNTWLITIARHIIFDYLRHKMVEWKFNDYALKSFDISADLESEQTEKQLRSYLTKTIEQLPVQQKEVLLLKSKGYDNKEIALRLNLSKRTVETHINRALKVLRIQLKEIKVFLLFF